MQADIIIKNIKECVTLNNHLKNDVKEFMNDPKIIPNAGIAVKNGKILEIDKTKTIEEKYTSALEYSGDNLVALPGFVDPHTHIVFAKEREKEFEMRIQGKSYKEISLADGGIRSSVRHLRNTGKKELYSESLKRIDNMLRLGTTTIEAKSGYGLSTESEVKMLEVIQELNQKHPVDIEATFLGAHEYPDEYRDNKEKYIEILIEEMLPKIAENNLAKYCDVFTEDHVFNIEESKRILKKAIELGFKIRMHADELEPLGGAELAAELNANSADHLIAVSQKGIEALSESETIPIFLPATCFSLGLDKYAPAQKFLEKNKGFALATDCNPGSSFTESMPFVISLACLKMKLSVSEALYAACYFSAKSLELENKIGRLASGFNADITLWDMNSYRSLPYHVASLSPKFVFKNGKAVVENYCLTY